MTHEHAPHGGHHPKAHPHDRGPAAVLRYARLIARLWRSDVNTAVVRELSLKPNERVLDLGAGAGAATVEAARTGAHVLAVDPMPFMRGILRLRTLAPGARGKVEVLLGAAESLPVENGSIDALWTVNTLHHWTNHEAAARELARVLKPGGRVLLVEVLIDDPAHPEHEAFARKHHRHHFDQVDPTKLAALLEQAGFASAQGTVTRFANRPACRAPTRRSASTCRS